jgi:hypothetical protein
MKVLKNSTLAKNIIIYILLQPMFLHIQISNKLGQSSLRLEAVTQILWDYRAVFILGLISIVLIAKGKELSKAVTGLYLMATAIFGFIPFFSEFDKLILIGSFLNILFSFYLWLLWKLELKEACYHPGFNKNQIGKLNEYELPITLSRGGTTYYGYLTNWDGHSAFFYLKDYMGLKGKYDFEVNFSGNTFKSQAEVVSKYGNGYGIKFHSEPSTIDFGNSWYDFYTMIKDRGYASRMV